MRIKHSNKRIVFETALTVLCGCFVVFACLVDFIDIPFLAMLKIRVSDVEAMHMNLFTIQATISVTGAAIISLLTGVTSKEFYGISVSKFITRIYPVFLKHHAVIIFTFAITFVDYFAVSLRLFDVSLAIFACSVLALIYLVRDTFIVFMGDNEIKNRIAESIKESNLTGYAQALVLQSKQYAQAGLFIELKDNLTLVETVLEQEEQRFKISSDNTHIELIESFLVDIFKIIVNRQHPDENIYYLRYMLNLYKKANENNVYFNLWWISPNLFFQSIRFITHDEYQANHHIFLNYYQSLLINEKYDLELNQDKDKILNNSLIYYSGTIFKTLFASDKQSLLSLYKDTVTLDLYEDLSMLQYYNHCNEKTIKSEYEKLLVQLDLAYYAKCIIDKGDSGKVWDKLFSDFHYGSDWEQDFSFVCITNYLFYLAEYESLAKDKPAQLISKKLLKEHSGKILDWFYRCNLLEIVKKYKTLLFSVTNRWEWFEEDKAKLMISEYSTTDYLIFMAINTCWNDDDIEKIVELLSDGSMFGLYSRYFSKESSFEDLYAPFHSIFFDNYGFEDRKARLLGILNKKYRQEILSKVESKIVSDQDIEDYKTQLLGYCAETKSEFKKLFCIEDSDDGETVNPQTIKLLSLTAEPPLSDEYINRIIKEKIEQQLLLAYLSIIDKELSKQSIKKKEKKIAQTIIENIKGINVDVAFGMRFVLWGDENKTRLKDYLESQNIEIITSLHLPNDYYFISTSATNVRIHGFRVEIRELTPDEIIRYCKEDEKGELSYNVTNDIYIPFSESELYDYIRKTKMVVEIYVELSNHETSDNCGLHITLED